MEATLYNQSGQQIGSISLAESVFGIIPNVPVMHQYMVMQQANARSGTQNTRGRGEVVGSTRKLYRQKGTGRARQGSARAPHRKGGGVAHGPHPRKYTKAMPRKMRRLAVRSALSAKHAASAIHFVDAIAFERPRTKDMLDCLKAFNISGSALIVLAAKNDAVQRSASNIPDVKTLVANYLNVVDILQYDHVLMVQPAVMIAEGILGQAEEALSGEESQS